MNNNSLNLNMEDLNEQLKAIEAQRQKLLEQLELATKVDAIAAELVKSLTSKIDELEQAQQVALVKKILEALHPYLPSDFITSSNTASASTESETTTKRKRGELATLEDFTGVIKLSERFGAKKEQDGSYTALVGFDNRRTSKNNTNSANLWREYLKGEYTETIELFENGGNLIQGAYLVVASALTLPNVGQLVNLNFEVTPDSEENKVNSNKQPQNLDENLVLVNSAATESEVLTESIRETEPVEVLENVPNIDISAYLPEELIGAKIRTNAYGKEMHGVLIRYVEDDSKPWRADTPDMPIEARLADGGFEILELPQKVAA